MLTPVHPDVLFDIETYFNYLFFITDNSDAKVVSASTMNTSDTYYAVKLSSLQVTQACWLHTSKLFHRLDKRRSFGLQGGHLYNTNMDTNWARGDPLITMAHRGSQRSFMLTLLQNKGLAFSAPSANFAHHITRDVVLLSIIQRMYREHMLATIKTIKDQDEAQRVFEKKNKYIQNEIGRLLGE